jgi:hypothetical protein
VLCAGIINNEESNLFKYFLNIIITSYGKHTYSAVLFVSNLLRGGENEPLQYHRAGDLVASQLNITPEKVSLKA